MSLITHIELSAGSTTWRIAASKKNAPSTVRQNVVVSSIDGILDPGELSESPIARSYSDGYVWNPNATRTGKDISIDVVFYAENPATLRSDFSSFRSFIANSAAVTLKTFGLENTYQCQPQALEVTDTHDNTAISCTIVLASREAI